MNDHSYPSAKSTGGPSAKKPALGAPAGLPLNALCPRTFNKLADGNAVGGQSSFRVCATSVGEILLVRSQQIKCVASKKLGAGGLHSMFVRHDERRSRVIANCG